MATQGSIGALTAPRSLTARPRVRERVISRASLGCVLTLSALLETWRVTVSGYGNGYYAEAALAASRSWTAMLTNTADPSGLVSLDKGPLPDWVLGLSTRVLGFDAAGLLLPAALFTVASVLVLYDLVRRTLGSRCALLAALILALTPVSVVMGRYDNPDPLLTLLLTCSAWALIRSLQSGRTRHLILAGALVGLGFETKMLEAYLVLPALATTLLLAAPGPPRARLRRLAAGALATISVSLAWYATMMLLPAGSRPYVPDTGDDSWFSLIGGANGLKRVTGFPGSHQPGPLRLFAPQIAGQASWLLPLALLGLLVGLVIHRRAPRTDLRRATLVLLGGWLLTGWAVFSFSRGLFHPYYTTVIAPPTAALTAAAVVGLTRRAGSSRLASGLLALGILGTALLSWAILDHTPSFLPWLRWLVLAAGGLLAAALVLASAASAARASILPRGARARALSAGALATALLGGPAAYSIATLGFGRGGANPTAGPEQLTPARGRAGMRLDGTLVSYLQSHRDGARYLLAATGADFAAPVGLATKAPVITLGGFDGSNPAPSIAQLATLVRAQRLRFVLLASPQPSPASRALARWVLASCASVQSVSVAGLRGENGSRLAGPAHTAQVPAGLYRCG
jgi:4-amino-4-deoxy-L-arabinose transferase-like glycosyltransferase